MDITLIIQAIQASITTLNHSYTQIAVDVAVLKTQVNQLLWINSAFLGATIIFLVNRGWKILINWKNNKQ